jgi:BlaI family transcriptional regulator, penicillinase repressor
LNPKFKFGRENARNALALGNLERTVMETLWDGGEMSGSEIYKKLGRKLKILHNTMLTVLERLISKGLVTKRKDGKFGYYKPLITRDEFCRMVADPIFTELLQVSKDSAMAAFVDQACRDWKTLDQLKSLIDEVEKKNKSGR